MMIWVQAPIILIIEQAGDCTSASQNVKMMAQIMSIFITQRAGGRTEISNCGDTGSSTVNIN
uniref:Uncharacterized protein n=1 Tax=Arion vulgaris TaxID=1028688 RepID=A0A0B6ZZM6_9EUPU